MSTLVVIRPGALSLVQDLGRPGWSSIGVSCSGAFDRVSLALANRLVGNPEDSAAIETLLGGLSLQAQSAMTLAVTGASGPMELLRGSGSAGRWQSVDRRAPLHLMAGDRISIGNPVRGLRTYVAIRGGIDVEPVLGSRSHDQLSGLGPTVLAEGDLLPVGPQPADWSAVDFVPEPTLPTALEVIPGPHHRPETGLFRDEALDVLQSAAYLVEASSNRIGVRLRGPALPRQPGELASAPMRPGAIQVPSDGQPIILGPDAPTTGGFPVLGTLTPAAFSAIGQARPGDLLRFRVLRNRTISAAE